MASCRHCRWALRRRKCPKRSRYCEARAPYSRAQQAITHKSQTQRRACRCHARALRCWRRTRSRGWRASRRPGRPIARCRCSRCPKSPTTKSVRRASCSGEIMRLFVCLTFGLTCWVHSRRSARLFGNTIATVQIEVQPEYKFLNATMEYYVDQPTLGTRMPSQFVAMTLVPNPAGVTGKTVHERTNARTVLIRWNDTLTVARLGRCTRWRYPRSPIRRSCAIASSCSRAKLCRAWCSRLVGNRIRSIATNFCSAFYVIVPK